MQGFMLDLVISFGVAFLVMFIPVIAFKQITKNVLPFRIQKNIAIIAGIIALLYTCKKFLG